MAKAQEWSHLLGYAGETIGGLMFSAYPALSSAIFVTTFIYVSGFFLDKIVILIESLL
jgi:hypothetical protein